MLENDESWKWTIFGKNGKPIALLFGQISCFWPVLICARKWRKLKMDDFWQKWQAYSLTFWQKYRVFVYFLICARKWIKLKMDDFWQKWQAYSLTFWPNIVFLGTFEPLPFSSSLLLTIYEFQIIFESTVPMPGVVLQNLLLVFSKKSILWLLFYYSYIQG